MEFTSAEKFYKTEEIVYSNQTQKYEPDRYVNVFFTKGKYWFGKLKGDKYFTLKQGTTFGSIQKPTFFKKGYEFQGWLSDGKIVQDNYVINQQLILIPLLKKI